MKKIFLMGIGCIVFLSAACSSPKTDKNWKLVWSDDFNGSVINEKNWSYDIGYGPNDSGWGNGEREKYTNSPENSFIKQDHVVRESVYLGAVYYEGRYTLTRLVIKAVYLGGEYYKRSYTSARLNTKNKFEVQYGKIAARIKVPYGKGIWPAFWMLGSNYDKVGWPKCGEIDIMEMFGGGKGKDDTVLGTMHFYDPRFDAHVHFGGEKQLSDKLSDSFHVYEVEWDPVWIIWRIDGEEYHRENIDIKDFPERSAFHQPFYLLLNLAIGGMDYRIGFPDKTTPFPAVMEVNWVRVYKKK